MRKTKKTLAILALVAMVLTMIPIQVFAASDDTRISGADRIATAIAVADAGWTSADTVILAAADQANLVDALAAASLAGQEDAPILLTFKAALNADVAAKIKALGASKVYVVGAAQGLADAVDAIDGVSVEKLAGDSRWATADAINAKLSSPAGTFVVGYNAVADALSAASYAAANNYAIVLTKADGSVDASKLVGDKTYLVGGTSVVKDYEGATRLGGDDRFATNTAVVEGLTYSVDKVYVANGISLVDALVAAPLAAKAKAAVLLASATDVAAKGALTLTSSSKVIALGGANAVSDAVKGKVAYVAPAELAVESVSAINLNQIVVKFTQKVDETAAETPANYALGGVDLTAVDKFELSSSDKKTLTINLNAPKAQYATAAFKVKGNVIYGDGASSTLVPVYSQELTFSDVTVPTVSSVSVTGNKKLTVTFSETVKMVAGGGGFAAIAGTKFKIDGQYLTNYGFSSATAINSTTGNDWANKIELNFATAIPAGDHTLTTLAGDTTNLFDAANFKVVETTTNFTIASVTNAPTVVSVEGQNNGTIYVTYDRSMNANAYATGNYRINGNALAGAVGSFKSGTDSKVVKFTGVPGVAKGANVLTIVKDTVTDSYGNKLDASNDIRVAFDATEDVTKPTVTSVSALTNTKVRVKFSEAVSSAYATNLANYTLKNSSGSTVTLTVVPVQVAADTYDLTTPSLTGSNYTLTIKNVVDTAATPNKMDTYTATFSGNDDQAPTVTEAVQVGASPSQKVAVLFSEAMDASTITNTANYLYIDNAGTPKTRNLPSGTTVVAGADNKSVQITFPSSYQVNGGAATEYSVINLIIGNVKDVAGNTLQNISVSTATLGNIKAAGAGTVKPDYVAKTFILTATSSKVTAEFELDQNITTLNISDFRVGGKAPDSGYVSGKKIILEFTDTATPGDMAAIKLLGNTAQLTTVAQTSTNIYGTIINAFAAQNVYDDKIAPKLLTVTAGADAKKINLTFSEPIDQTILGLYDDDFTVESAGRVNTVSSVSANGANGLILNLATSISGTATVKANAANISIKSLATDIAETSDMYVPSTADQDGSKTVADGFGPVAGTPVITATVAGQWGQTLGDTITITFDEAVAPATLNIAGIAANGSTSAPLALGGIFAAGNLGVFATPAAGANVADVRATVNLDATGKVVTVTVTTVGVAVDSPAGAFTQGAAITDLAGN